ncbi:WD repeat-containing protein 43 [Dermacentor variabilis]|uniref:WD repeat-containing protein 43 n=1 Tax=Dermacentor variabilis TaxID=34621 RepID=UPI003F5C4E99
MASLVEAVAVSDSGEYLAHSSSDGRLKLWDTSTGRLKQEYTPSAHLSAKCTCLSWGPTRQGFATHKKRKRQKTSDDAADALSEASLLAMGTAEGTVLLYSLTRGDLHSELTGGHTAAVNGVSWHANSDSLFSVSDDQHIVHWSVSSSKVKSKWKADRHSVYAVAAVDANTVLTASSSIKWWNVDTKSIVMKFTGHVTEVRQILPVFVPSKTGEGRTYFLTCAANDRQVSAWHLEKGASSSSLANFVLSEEAVHISISHTSENSKTAHLSAVTKSGALHIFELQLNGRCRTPVQPKFTVQVATETQNGKAPKPQPVAILAAAFCPTGDRLLLCYNSFLSPSFEHLNIATDLREQTWLVRQVKPPVSCSTEDGISQVKQPVQPTREVTTLAPGHLAPSIGKRKTPADSMGQLPMEERLLAVAQASGKEPPRADNLSQLLLQGLQSEDPRLLNSVLQRTDEALLRNTVRRLPLSSVMSLLKELQQRMHSRGSGVYPYMKWTKTVVSTHTSYLMTCKEAGTLLKPLLELLEARTEMFEKVCRLRGKVDLIMAQVATRHEAVELPTEPLCLVNDDSSDDDMDQDPEGPDTDGEESNIWELSDGERSQSEADENSGVEDGEAGSEQESSQDEDDGSDIA